MPDMLAMPFIPAQHQGEATETSSHHVCDGEDAARVAFAAAVQRLKAVNGWKALCGKLSADFQLVDLGGTAVNGPAQAGLYIRIDIPGPGSTAGQGYDWVLIEKVEDVVLNDHQEISYLRTRPTQHPLHKTEGVAHFLHEDATATFIITRNYDQLTATMYGRNEVPNSHTGNMLDDVRNAIIGASGAIGVSKLQWGAWAKGMLGRTDS